MTPRVMAQIHAACFSVPRPWAEVEFEQLKKERFVHFHFVEGSGFLIGRTLAGETELLTLAVHPDVQRQGLAHSLIQTFEGEAGLRESQEIFLEVAADNHPAQALYRAHGYQMAGLRPKYYGDVDALVLRKPLSLGKA